MCPDEGRRARRSAPVSSKNNWPPPSSLNSTPPSTLHTLALADHDLSLVSVRVSAAAYCSRASVESWTCEPCKSSNVSVDSIKVRGAIIIIMGCGCLWLLLYRASIVVLLECLVLKGAWRLLAAFLWLPHR